MISGLNFITAAALTGLFAAAPTSTNFTLKSYDFGNGGGSGSSSTYNLNGSTGVQSGASQTSSTYGLKPGETPTQDANVPPAATLSNPNNTYNKLTLVLNTGNNPTDTRFAIAISSDNFVTTQYVQNDTSLGVVLGIEDHQTYAQWGGATGFTALGLLSNTTYKVRVSALQGNFTGSAFGPESSGVATSQPTISFGVESSTDPTPPYNVNFTSLSPNSVFSADADAVLSLSSNAELGGAIYVRGINGGLSSPSKGFTIASATTDLSVAASGYGGQVTSTSQSNGGPLGSVPPFNGTSNAVGLLNTSLQAIVSTPSPVTNGSTTFNFKAKTTISTPAANDYNDRLTFIAGMLF